MSIIKPYNPWETIDPQETVEKLGLDQEFQLIQWPIKLWKVPTVSPYYHHAHLLVAADCCGFAYGKLHEKMSIGRVPLICCPETDFDIVSKLSEIIQFNDIKSITVIRMEAACCADLTDMVMRAIKQARKTIPMQITTVFIDCEVMDEDASAH